MSQAVEQVRFCTSRDGTRIAYATSGSGPPLVWVGGWVHHFTLDWDSPIWHPWLSLVARRHTLVRYDWRGCGLSDRNEVEFSFEKFVEAVEDFLPKEPAGAAAPGGSPLDPLTTREREVLELIAQGLDNDAIGKQLHISKRTARNYVFVILSKLGATSRTQAIVPLEAQI